MSASSDQTRIAASETLPFDPELHARRAQRRDSLPAHSARREGHAHHRSKRASEIAASIARELERLGAPYQRLRAGRPRAAPATDMPAEVLDDMETSQVSIFAVQAQPNELRSRMQMTDVVNRRKMRHAHMVNINRQIMLEGMRADFDEVDRISRKVWRSVSAARDDPRHHRRRHRHRRPS